MSLLSTATALTDLKRIVANRLISGLIEHYGLSGSGKTLFLVTVVKDLLSEGFSVIWVTRELPQVQLSNLFNSDLFRAVAPRRFIDLDLLIRDAPVQTRLVVVDDQVCLPLVSPDANRYSKVSVDQRNWGRSLLLARAERECRILRLYNRAIDRALVIMVVVNPNLNHLPAIGPIPPSPSRYPELTWLSLVSCGYQSLCDNTQKFDLPRFRVSFGRTRLSPDFIVESILDFELEPRSALARQVSMGNSRR
jgi:hypothetical protein